MVVDSIPCHSYYVLEISEGIHLSTKWQSEFKVVFSKQTKIEGWARVEERRNENRNKPWTKASSERCW